MALYCFINLEMNQKIRGKGLFLPQHNTGNYNLRNESRYKKPEGGHL